MRNTLVGLGLSGCLFLTACGGSATTTATPTTAPAAPTTTTPTTAPTTTTPTTAPTTTAPTTTAPTTAPTTTEVRTPNDAEPGLQFDIGAISSIEDVDGVTVIMFDRYQVYDDASGELLSGTQLQKEYTFDGALTDWPFVNENSALRSYPLAPSVQVLITDKEWFDSQSAMCGFDNEEISDTPAVYTPTVLEVGLKGAPASLTFGEFGWVTTVRFMLSC